MKKSLLTKLLLMLFVAFAGIAVTSCGDDDEPLVQNYTFVSEIGEDSGIAQEDIKIIKHAFCRALKVSSDKDSFTLDGSAADCDARVKTACAVAAESLKGTKFHSTGTFVVLNYTTGKSVYNYRFTKD